MPKGSEVLRMLKKAGCKFLKHGTNHDWWINPKSGEKFQVPRHKSQEVHPDTLREIKKSAGIE